MHETKPQPRKRGSETHLTPSKRAKPATQHEPPVSKTHTSQKVFFATDRNFNAKAKHKDDLYNLYGTSQKDGLEYGSINVNIPVNVKDGKSIRVRCFRSFLNNVCFHLHCSRTTRIPLPCLHPPWPSGCYFYKSFLALLHLWLTGSPPSYQKNSELRKHPHHHVAD